MRKAILVAAIAASILLGGFITVDAASVPTVKSEPVTVVYSTGESIETTVIRDVDGSIKEIVGVDETAEYILLFQ